MSDERARILQMVSDGKIDSAQGVELLNAMRTAGQPDRPAAHVEPGKASWLRVRVTDLATGRAKVNVNLPFSLVRVGLKMGTRFAPEMDGIDVEELMAAIKEGAVGRLVDVEDLEGGEKVEVFFE